MYPDAKVGSPVVYPSTASGLVSPRFPRQHTFNPRFARDYTLLEELGSGGYSFVMVALHRPSGLECAVKFIVKAKIPARAWVLLDDGSRLPSEIVLLRAIDHAHVVKFIEWFEDEDHFYLVQELHGSPWFRTSPSPTISASSSLPSLSPSDSTDSITLSPPITPPSSPFCAPQLRYPRRPSYDLFEFIEHHKEKRLSEAQARYVLKQVVEAVFFLDGHGLTHRDIKARMLLHPK
ncbi:Protein kinase domain-containing protein [Mycena chlorophos]|uniref:Protein kinase domain-containing protein n=1 Tax=Mycena chlorophos TaxID=658473 RepID=A0A8H6TS93_MYCCL|nr:Protein kinase domain-containing protein [Mycena chlorophos]